MTLGISDARPLVVVGRAFGMRYAYGFADMLPLYVLFLALSPLALALMAARRTPLVIAASLAFWIGGALMPEAVFVTRTAFSDVSWQVCFFLPLVAGYHGPYLRERWQGLGPRRQREVAIGLGALATGLLFLSWLDSYRHVLWREHLPLLRFLFEKTRVGPGRLCVAGVWLLFLYGVAKRFEPVLRRTVGVLFEPLGRNSLYVYIVQSAFVFPLFNVYTTDFWPATFRGGLVLAAIWIMARERVLFDWIPR
jgi:hypothetical protein